MSEKKNFMLRLDLETFKTLEKWAADEFRSINGQIDYLLNQSIKESGRKTEIGKKKQKVTDSKPSQ